VGTGGGAHAMVGAGQEPNKYHIVLILIELAND
jgi:hypothetical protein